MICWEIALIEQKQTHPEIENTYLCSANEYQVNWSTFAEHNANDIVSLLTVSSVLLSYRVRLSLSLSCE